MSVFGALEQIPWLFFNPQVLQREREEKLITILKNRLETFVDGQADEFTNWAKSEARRLSAAGTFCSSINILYHLKK